jgi:hypothetical protein
VFERGITTEGEPLLGIRYLSRLGDDIENWAIFEGTEPYDKRFGEIARDDPDVVAALQTLDLVMAEPESAERLDAACALAVCRGVSRGRVLNRRQDLIVLARNRWVEQVLRRFWNRPTAAA